MNKSRRSLIFLCLIVFALSNAPTSVATAATLTPFPNPTLAPRQVTLPPVSPVSPTSPPPTSDTGSSTTPSATPSTPSSSSTTPSSTSSAPPSTSSSPPAVTSPPPSTTSQPPTQPLSESLVLSTDPGGSVVEVTTTVTPTDEATSTTSSAAATNTSTKKSDDSGLGTGSIIGLSVAGGVAVIGIVGFIIWKLTRKRGFNDFDDNEAIKWPELNAHKDGSDSHPLPTHNTGRAGFETGGANLSRVPSTSSAAPTQYSAPSQYSNVYNTSTPDLYQDPYAVPPLPHLNPNQPYHDDPNQAAGYYDPYRGPVPQALHDPDGPPTATLANPGGPWEGGEAIPMTQMAAAGRARSPGPAMAYDTGRASPAPGAAGRMSPGPGVAYGGDPFGRRSPGPGQAYDAGVGRRSPGPYNAYAGQ